MISWRNPDVEQGHFDLDSYADAVLEARDAVASITRRPAAHLIGACSGGIIGASALGHLAADGRLGEIASLSLLVAALDNERAGTASALANREIAAAAVADSARRGYVDGRALEGVFTWLRRTTSCGATSSTTTCWASSRRRSTSSTGTTTRCASRPACTATSSGSAWRTRSRGPARSRCSAPGRPGRRRSRQLHRRRLDRPHHPVGERVPEHAAARRRVALRALRQRAHPGARRPARACPRRWPSSRHASSRCSSSSPAASRTEDRRIPVPQRGDHQDPPRARLRQARRARPRPGRGPRLRDGLVHPGHA